MKTMAGATARTRGEQVADAGRADADERLDELRAGDREERHAGLAGDRLGEQRLAAAGRAEQQHALGRRRAERLVLGGVRQVVDDLPQLGDRLVGAGDVGERDQRLAASSTLPLPIVPNVLTSPIAQPPPLPNEKSSANRLARIISGSRNVVTVRTTCLPDCLSTV